MKRLMLVWLLCLSAVFHVCSQSMWVGFNEDLLKGRVKQVDEFMSRFNMEETWDGKKITDRNDSNLRKEYIRYLFDNDKYRNADGSYSPVVDKFVNAVVDGGYTIHYEDSTWTAVVKCDATICDKSESITLLLKTQRQAKGEYVWIITDVKGKIFSFLSDDTDTEKKKLFISPMEHEIGFIGILDKPYRGADLRRMVADSCSLSRLSMLAMLMESGLLKLKAIQRVYFLFSSIPGWSFTVSRKEKKGSYNTGWLITEIKDIMQLNN